VAVEARSFYVIQRVSGRGYALTQVRKETLRIGRGTNADLRSENPAVALEHAIIEPEAGGYLITDKGSITGTYVNRKPVESARLAKGDIIEIGDLRIDIQLVEPGKPLFLRVIPTAVRAPGAAEEDDEGDSTMTMAPLAASTRVVRSKKIDYAGAYRLARPWLTKLTLTAFGLIVALVVVGEMIRPERQKAFMPGGLSSAHGRAQVNGVAVASNCQACHTPWKSVENSKCRSCHDIPPHAQNEVNPPDCFECHAEHRGAAKLAADADLRCTGCHADLTRHVRGAVAPEVARIPFFGDSHPELVPPPDPDRMRFNHKLHLAKGGVFNASGRREKLECTSCHNLVTTGDRIDPVPLKFDAHCQRCHRLTFDARLPDEEVPHGGDPKNLYGYIALRYAGNRDLVGKPPEVVRRILATRKSVALDARAQIAGEHVIKTKCAQCHEITTREPIVAVTPVIRRDWFPGAKFSHGKHSNIDCEKCHSGARNSVATPDVLMPVRKDCTDCHARNASQAPSTCKTCHGYHASQRLVKASLATGGLGREGRMLQQILVAVIVILLLVVLVPVGIALFQRLRPERAGAPPKRQAPPPPQPPTQKVPAITGNIPTDKVNRTSVPVVPPPVVPPPKIDATQVESPLPTGGAEEGRGTQMVEWYGLLKCTSGALDGQRFTIEEGGLYIGRDPALSQVVIPDTKISKRHVRILPRDGKVWAIDEGSTNGTFIAGSPNRITEVQLKRGDTLILGDNTATFVYQI